MDIVIFGASGDLARRKLFPAIESLFSDGTLPSDSRIIGFSRSAKETPDFPFEYISLTGQYDSKEDMARLKEILRPNRRQLFYLAVPPSVYAQVLSSIHHAELVTKDDPAGFRLILAEKPFGEGLAGAEHLISLAEEYFGPDQLLKVDHYAGKKELRDLEEHDLSVIKKISFEIHERADAEGRNGFYDKTGALRDVGQNHLLFMLSTFFRGSDHRSEVLSFLKSKRKIGGEETDHVFGKYQGYDPIETFFSIPAVLDKKETRHIDIQLSAGKALAEDVVRISIEFFSGETKEIILASGHGAHAEIFKDALQGKSSSFLSDDEVRESWRFIEEMEKIKDETEHVVYPKGSHPHSIQSR